MLPTTVKVYMSGKMCVPLQWEYKLYDLGEAGQPLEFIRLLGKCASQYNESIYVWEDVLPIAMGIQIV